ncbi:ferrous iron transport protein A [Streptomyces venezuelae]|uniref:FeoA family protein n=1 Tax=Streptomyces venezuelae TaxID=54571 RepID=UPI003659E3AF
MPSLNDCPPGTTVRVVGATGPDRRRLFDFGFVPGAEVTVIARSVAGGVLVGLGDARVALDSGTASRLRHR